MNSQQDKILASLLVIILLTVFTGYSQTNCSLKKSANDINVYLCDSNIGNFKTIIVELDVPATLSQYAAIVLDIDNYTEWQYKIKKPEIIKSVSKSELYYYSEVDTPWPTSNRDFIFHLEVIQDKPTKVLTIKLTEMPDFIPGISGIIRIPEAESTLTVTPIDKANVRVRYVLDINPGGDIPAWIANVFAAQAPWQTYNNFRNRVIEEGDERSSVSFIEDY